MAFQTAQLNEALYNYMLSVSSRETAVMKQLRETTARMFPNQAEMQISPEQGQFMALLVELIGAKKTLELGVFTGYSALRVASVLPANGKLVACDVSKEWTDVAQSFWQQAGVADKIDLRIGPALTTLDQLMANGETNTFDFSFIDADKVNYPAYYEKVLQLTRPGGLIAIDNVFQDGRVADPQNKARNTEVIRGLNKLLHQDERVNISMVPISDGLTLVRKL